MFDTRRTRLTFELLAREAPRALLRNKLRSALSTLGIAIGVGSVVCVVAIGKAGTDAAEAQLANLGDNFVWIEAGSRNVNGVRTGAKGMNTLTVGDAEAIRASIPLLSRATPQVDGTAGISWRDRNWTTRYRGVNADYLPIKAWPVVLGAPFTDTHVEESASVVLLGQTVREQLFGGEDPIGATVRIDGGLFVVLGTLGPKGQSANGRDQDDTIVLPYTTVMRRFVGHIGTSVDDILCSATDAGAIDGAIDLASNLLRERHHLPVGAPDDFNIRRPDEAIKEQIATSRTLSWMLDTVASVSLLVGGIGVMNVMLVSVTQRTREIGLRVAIGATPGQVLVQFLGEAIALCLAGGLVGELLGVAAATAITRSLGWPVAFPASLLVIAPCVSVAAGLVSGLYPAWKAARLDPVIALASE